MAQNKYQTYSGVTLPLATVELEQWIKSIIPQDFQYLDGWNFDGFDLGNLPTPSIPVAPEFKLGILHWPTGAVNPAVYNQIVNTVQLNQIRTAVGNQSTFAANAAPLVLADGRSSKTITASMYYLPARPLAQWHSDASDLWILTLTDQRFYWPWMRGIIDEQPDSWGDLYDTLAGFLNTTITVDTIPAAYGTPSEKWIGAWRPTPAVLDSVAATVGQRIICLLDGTVKAVNWSNAQNATYAYLNQSGFKKQAGGLLDLETINHYLPASVLVGFNDTTVDQPAAQPFVIAVLSSVASSTNIVDNGTFETGTLASWTTGGSITATASNADPNTGVYSARWVGAGTNSGTLQQTLTTVIGQSYSLSFWLKNTGSTNTFVATANGVDLLTITNDASGVYTQHTITFTATITNPVLKFTSTPNAGHTQYLDDIGTGIPGIPSTQMTIFGDLVYDGTNEDDCNEYAVQAATDWYGWAYSDIDISIPGVEPFVPTGWEDATEWTFQSRGVDNPYADTRIRRGPFNDYTSGSWLNTVPPPPSTGFFGRLTDEVGGNWNFYKQKLSSGVYVDDGAEITGYSLVPDSLGIDLASSNLVASTPQTDDRVWIIPSQQSGKYESRPVAIANPLCNGLIYSVNTDDVKQGFTGKYIYESRNYNLVNPNASGLAWIGIEPGGTGGATNNIKALLEIRRNEKYNTDPGALPTLDEKKSGGLTIRAYYNGGTALNTTQINFEYYTRASNAVTGLIDSQVSVTSDDVMGSGSAIRGIFSYTGTVHPVYLQTQATVVILGGLSPPPPAFTLCKPHFGYIAEYGDDNSLGNITGLTIVGSNPSVKTYWQAIGHFAYVTIVITPPGGSTVASIGGSSVYMSLIPDFFAMQYGTCVAVDAISNASFGVGAVIPQTAPGSYGQINFPTWAATGHPIIITANYIYGDYNSTFPGY